MSRCDDRLNCQAADRRSLGLAGRPQPGTADRRQPRRAPRPRSLGCSSMSCRPAQPASGARGPPHATGGGRRAAPRRSAQSRGVPGRLLGDPGSWMRRQSATLPEHADSVRSAAISSGRPGAQSAAAASIDPSARLRWTISQAVGAITGTHRVLAGPAFVARSQRLGQLAEARRSSRSSAWPDSTPVRMSRATASSSATCGLVSE